MNIGELPPNIEEHDAIILFDGVCKICNVWSRFIIKYDSHRRFKLASVQSEEGQKVLDHFGFPTDNVQTMLYIVGNNAYQQSDAFLMVMSKLGYPWKLLSVLFLIPRSIRNWFYDRIALNRYAIFGRYDYCKLPAADHSDRYLQSKLKSEI